MTDAITLIKGKIGLRDETLRFLTELQKRGLSNKVTIQKCYVSFGWPDFILLLNGKNVELIKNAIIEIRDLVNEETGDNLETSTIICTTQKEIEDEKNKMLKR